jgi:hypothetical protein
MSRFLSQPLFPNDVELFQSVLGLTSCLPVVSRSFHDARVALLCKLITAFPFLVIKYRVVIEIDFHCYCKELLYSLSLRSLPFPFAASFLYLNP